jgi:hypothetical protein
MGILSKNKIEEMALSNIRYLKLCLPSEPSYRKQTRVYVAYVTTKLFLCRKGFLGSGGDGGSATPAGSHGSGDSRQWRDSNRRLQRRPRPWQLAAGRHQQVATAATTADDSGGQGERTGCDGKTGPKLPRCFSCIVICLRGILGGIKFVLGW